MLLIIAITQSSDLMKQLTFFLRYCISGKKPSYTFQNLITIWLLLFSWDDFTLNTISKAR